MNNLKCCINDKVNNFEGPEYIDAGDCLLSEAIAHIEALLMASSWAGSKVNLAAQKFLDEVKGVKNVTTL